MNVRRSVLLLSLSVTAARRAEDLLEDDDRTGLLPALLDLVGDVLPFVFTHLTKPEYCATCLW